MCNKLSAMSFINETFYLSTFYWDSLLPKTMHTRHIQAFILITDRVKGNYRYIHLFVIDASESLIPLDEAEIMNTFIKLTFRNFKIHVLPVNQGKWYNIIHGNLYLELP